MGRWVSYLSKVRANILFLTPVNKAQNFKAFTMAPIELLVPLKMKIYPGMYDMR